MKCREHTGNLESLQSPLVLDSKVRKCLLLQRLLLSLHDIRQARIPRLIQSQIRRNNHRQLRLQRLRTPINLMNNLHRPLPILNINLTRLRRLRPPQQPRKHLPRLSLVPINRLLPQQHQVNVLLLDNALEHLGDGQRFRAVVALGDVDVEGAVGAHGHGGAQGVGAFGAAGGEGEDVVDGEGAFAFAEADGFFDGELVEGVEGVFDAGGFDAGLGFVDAGFDLLHLISIYSVYNSYYSFNSFPAGIPSMCVGGRRRQRSKTYRVVNHPLDGHQNPQCAHGESVVSLNAVCFLIVQSRGVRTAEVLVRETAGGTGDFGGEIDVTPARAFTPLPAEVDHYAYDIHTTVRSIRGLKR